MRVVGEQMENEFGLMTLNTVRPLDPIALPKEGGTDRLATRAWLDLAIMIDENPSRMKGHRSIMLSFGPHPPLSVYFKCRSNNVPDLSPALRLPHVPKLRQGHDPVPEATVLCSLPDHHTTDLEATRRTVRFVCILPFVRVSDKGE